MKEQKAASPKGSREERVAVHRGVRPYGVTIWLCNGEFCLRVDGLSEVGPVHHFLPHVVLPHGNI